MPDGAPHHRPLVMRWTCTAAVCLPLPPAWPLMVDRHYSPTTTVPVILLTIRGCVWALYQ